MSGPDSTAARIYEMAQRLNDVLGAMSCSSTHLLNCLKMQQQKLTTAELAHFQMTALEMTMQLCDYAALASDLPQKLQRAITRVNERLIDEAIEHSAGESEGEIC